jgi:hypothetical protein
MQAATRDVAANLLAAALAYLHKYTRSFLAAA